MARTEDGEVLEDDGLVDIIADSADEDSFLGLGAFLHKAKSVQYSSSAWPSTAWPRFPRIRPR